MLLAAKELTPSNFRFSPPELSLEELEECLFREYGIRGSLDVLVGERDQNTRVTTSAGKQYILKIASPDESQELIDFQIQALEHIRIVAPAIKVPRHIPTLDGNLFSTTRDDRNRVVTVRLLTYLSGRPLSSMEPPSYNTITDVGRMVGALSLALSSFSHPAESHFMPWDSLNGLVLSEEFQRQYFPEDLVECCDNHFARLRAESFSKLKALPAQVIHNDAHYGNVLCDPDKPEKVTGVIDFGDIIKRPIVVELSVVLASVLGRNADIVQSTRRVIQGFEESFKIPNEQIELLYDALFARLALAVQLLSYRVEHVSVDSEVVDAELPDTIQALKNLVAMNKEDFLLAITA